MKPIRISPNPVTTLLVLASLFAAVLAVTSAPPAAGAEQCGAFEFRNTLDEPVKVKRSANGVETTLALLQPGTLGSYPGFTSDQTLVVRRPSDQKLLYTSNGCSALTVEITENTAPLGYTCQATNRAGADFDLRIQLTGVPDGAKLALNIERGDRTGDNFVFLGSSTIANPSIDTSETVTGQEGTWFAKARVRLADGTKLPRIDCGQVTLSDGPVTALPPGVAGNAALSLLETNCYVVTRLVDGILQSDVSVVDAGDPRKIYARSNDRFIGDVTDDPGTTNVGVTKVRIRGGENPGDYPCFTGWASGVDLDREDILDVEVLTAVPGFHEGGRFILWTVTTQSFGNAGLNQQTVYVTNTKTREHRTVLVDNVEPLVISCDQRFLAARSVSQGGFSYFVVDLTTSARQFLNTPDDRAFGYGFDCDGKFWFEDQQPGIVSSIDLPFG